MIEKIYIIRHGERILHPFKRRLFSCSDRVPAQLGHYKLVRHDHTIYPHPYEFRMENTLGQVQLDSQEIRLSQRTEK